MLAFNFVSITIFLNTALCNIKIFTAKTRLNIENTYAHDIQT